jgi:L,D-peptidoglycan transpeptidase YkuD (ErfK/YbiS/YcfS/YnhG family)
MAIGRVVASCVAVLAIGGGVVVAVGMSGATAGEQDDPTPFSMPSAIASTYPAATWTPSRASSSPAATSTPVTRSSAAPMARPTYAATSSTAQPPKTTTVVAPAVAPTTAPTLVRGQALPIAGSTSDATRVITVVAGSYSSTTATLQAWDRAPGGGWLKRGSGVLAHVGSQGLTTQPSETKSATPIGSFTLTQAFGAYSNPGTGLPYFRTTAADWWISQSGSLYNTHQHCSGTCPFTQGSPNEHLLYETPYYNYAVVIDYNRWPVVQGAGSAFFLHVTDGSATAGCVAVPQSNLVSIMQWLTPTAHPRILIGVA